MLEWPFSTISGATYLFQLSISKAVNSQEEFYNHDKAISIQSLLQKNSDKQNDEPKNTYAVTNVIKQCQMCIEILGHIEQIASSQ